jgi:photosystem II stability/assembly factor-like uncharacterized protein
VGSAGDGGSIVKTTNAGRTWRVQKRIRGRGAFSEVACPTARSCYVLGDDMRGQAVWATSDGGRRWVRRRLPAGPWWTAIDFPTATTGWAVGSGGAVAKTADRGRTWQRVSLGSDLFDVSFCNSKVGYASSEGFVWRTTDAGTTWSARGVPAGHGDALTEVHCVSPTQAWALSNYGDAFVTRDGGTMWSWSPSPSQ